MEAEPSSDAGLADRLHALLSSGSSIASLGTSAGPKDKASPKEDALKSDTGPKSDHSTASASDAFERKRHASLDDLDFLYSVGRGIFAKIFLAQAKVSKRLYAVKIIKKESIVENDEIGHINVEKNLLLFGAKERHPFMVQYYGSFQTETRVFYLLEFVSGGNLMYHNQKGTRSPIPTTLTIVSATCIGYVG